MKSDTFTAQIESLDSDVWYYHFCLPSHIVQPFLAKDIKRVVCQINDSIEFQCALMPKGDGQYFINLNKERRKQLRLKIGDKIQAQIWEDNSKYGLPMPEELDELLQLDDEGSAHFHALTPGKQRALIHIAGSPKRSETRLTKALIIVDYLKASAGKLDFKALNEAFRRGR